jgi:hypothetical protein
MHNNKLYKDVAILEECLGCLPEDDVPVEISAIIQHESNGDLALKENAGYVPCEEVYGELLTDICCHAA